MSRWCDYSCEHAAFPDSPDLLGACRTMAAVFCKRLGKTVPKHTPCWAEREEEREEAHGPDETD